jgi:VWFA-related protein
LNSGNDFWSKYVRLSIDILAGSALSKILSVLPILFVPALLMGLRSIPTSIFPGESSQQDNSQTEAQAKITAHSDLVVLPVTVKDRNGHLVPGLQQNDFRVLDDNVEQSLDVFTAEAFPLSIVALIDDDLRSIDAEQVASSLQAIAAGISSNDEALICRFDLKFYPGEGFTNDPDKLTAEIKIAQDHSKPSTAPPVPWVISPSAHPRGVGEPSVAAPANLGHAPTKSLDDAVYASVELLKSRSIVRRKIILLISDGENGKQFNHYTYEDTVAALLRSNVSLYSLAVGGKSFHRKFSRLFAYANDTGGDIYYSATRGTLERLYSQIAEQARHEYTLAYRPRGNDLHSTYHVVKVLTTRDGFLVKTRPGYYTTPVQNIPER